jgi:hypothetical protein
MQTSWECKGTKNNKKHKEPAYQQSVMHRDRDDGRSVVEGAERIVAPACQLPQLLS